MEAAAFPWKALSPISWARPLRPRHWPSSCKATQYSEWDWNVQPSGSPGWASATTPQGSAVSSKPNPEAPRALCSWAPPPSLSLGSPSLRRRPRHLCGLTHSREGASGGGGACPRSGETCLCSVPHWVTWEWDDLGNSLSESHPRPPENSVFCSLVASCWGGGGGSNFSRRKQV